MSRTPVSVVWTTFAKLGPSKCHYPHQDDPCPWSLELESWRTGGNPYRHLDVQDLCPQNLKLESGRTEDNPDRCLDVQDTCLPSLKQICPRPNQTEFCFIFVSNPPLSWGSCRVLSQLDKCTAASAALNGQSEIEVEPTRGCHLTFNPSHKTLLLLLYSISPPVSIAQWEK